MESFWERVLQPQFFVLLVLRHPDHRSPLPQRRWLGALANGQYILLRREAYDSLGGHESVSGEVVEDLRLAQELVRAGHRLTIRGAEDAFATRMYRSLSEIVEGWGKNLFTASRQSVPRWLEPLIAPVSLITGALLWLVPPMVGLGLALAALAGPAPPVPSGVAVWSVSATALSLLFWMSVSARVGIPAAYGLLYPLGAAVSGYIYLRSWARGTRIRWKGRSYRPDGAEAEP